MDRAPIHLGHGENVYAFGAAVLPIIHAMQEVERITDLHGRAAQSARLDRVYAARVTARLGVAEAEEFREGRILLVGTHLALSAAKLSGAAWALTEPAPESRPNLRNRNGQIGRRKAQLAAHCNELLHALQRRLLLTQAGPISFAWAKITCYGGQAPRTAPEDQL